MAGKKKQRLHGQGVEAQKQLISVCMIVKDEEANLDRCLRSVRPIADEIVVVDTGSRDSTVEIARRHGAKVSHFEWCDDFAAARNAALKQATGRWVLQMDADEELAVEATRSIRRIVGSSPPQCWGYFIRVRCHGLRDGCETHTVIYRPLLFRNHRELHYKARIHEYIEYFGSGPKPEFRYHNDLAIEHHGYMPDQKALKDKAERNLRLLRQAAAEEPDEPYHQFNLGLEYYSNGRFAEAVEPLQRAVALCRNPSQNYLPNAYTMLVVSLSRVGRSSEVPTIIAEAEQRIRTLTADFYCNAGEALRIVGQLDEALSYFQRAIDVGEIRVAAPFDPGAHTWLPRSGMGMIYDQRGQLELALACYEEALAYVPQHPAINGRLAAVAARLGYPERALHHVERVLKLGVVPEEVWRDLLETCELLADAVAAGKAQLTDLENVVVDLLRRMPLRSDLGVRIASACLRFGQYERGIVAATAALEQGEDIMARVNRGLCYFSLGRYKEATDDFTAALECDPSNAEVLAKLGTIQPLLSRKVAAEHVSPTAVESWPDDAAASSKPLPPVSIVIPVFNGVAYTKRCLEAIIENTPEDLYEVVIVDNGSTDGTKDFLGLLAGDVKVITNQINLGLTQACNQGAQAATGKHVVFLHNDTEPQQGWLENLIALADSNPSVGAVGAKLVYPDGTLQEAGGIVFSDGALCSYGEGMDSADPRFNFVREVDYCSATALLIRRDLLQTVGGFDLDYTSGTYDDADLCFAIRNAGHRVLYQPAAAVTCRADSA